MEASCVANNMARAAQVVLDITRCEPPRTVESCVLEAATNNRQLGSMPTRVNRKSDCKYIGAHRHTCTYTKWPNCPCELCSASLEFEFQTKKWPNDAETAIHLMHGSRLRSRRIPAKSGAFLDE